MFNFILHPPSRLWGTSVFKNFHYVFDDGFHRIRVDERPVRKKFASSKRSETDTCARGPTHAIFEICPFSFPRYLFKYTHKCYRRRNLARKTLFKGNIKWSAIGRQTTLAGEIHLPSIFYVACPLNAGTVVWPEGRIVRTICSQPYTAMR